MSSTTEETKINQSYDDKKDYIEKENSPSPLFFLNQISQSPLEYGYSFWFSKRPSKNATNQSTAPTNPANYDANLRLVGTFNSVEKFWYYYAHMTRPHDLVGHADILMFKDGIRPLWEDDANKNGGKWIVRLKKGLANRCWENLILAILGEQFMVGEEICGAVVSCRYQEDLISIWNKTCSNQAVTSRIKDTLKRILNLPPSTILEYKSHNDSLKDNSSFHF
ncbi:eukaryotic translation initiation factor 4E type 2 isoform X3 [Brachionus plicatilis]|uniref:Eukaryotic translation initiation factor 4E type 2 isoform X3 n=1 Tax=Brachionus plicatilis TaxID=10195 RepID=A0A3M7RUT1_BRAPC|nr:eukaryotic translation initiation factor 4E type 2 isoform X3 [Brachionus plicatilis]